MRRLVLIVTLTLAATGLAAVPSAAVDEETAAPRRPEPPRVTSEVMIDLVDLGIDGDVGMFAEVLDRLLGDDLESVITVDGPDLVGAVVTEQGRRSLSRLGVVESVEQLAPLELQLTESVPQIGADALGVAGAGKVVAVIDVGVDTSLVGSVVAEACFVPDPQNGAPCPSVDGAGSAAPCVTPVVRCSHGSHIAAIIAGDEPSGVAPDAGILAIRAARFPAEDEPEISPLGVLEGLDHVLSLAATYDIAAVNLSFAGDAGDTCRDAAWEQRVSRLNDAGIAVVAAAGNLEDDDWEAAGVKFPACLPGVISVGSTTEAGEVSDFSMSSPVLDLLAPGECIDSAILTDGSCIATRGTSFAAPHVAAAFALIDDTHPDFTVARRRNLLRVTGEMVSRESEGPRDPRYPEIRVDRYLGFEPFLDAGSSAYWTAASDWALYAGVTTGIAPGVFGPTRSLTRAEAVTFLWRFMGSPVGHPSSGFPDVVPGSFYERAVDWALAAGVTTGLPGGVFGPGDPVTRAQLATFMFRTVGEPGGAPPSGFADVIVGSWYELAVAWMAQTGITTGTSPTTFSPERVIDRAQLITLLFRLADSDAAWDGGVEPPSVVLF